MNDARQKLRRQNGFTLTEVLVAMLILSTAIVSLMALISQNVRVTADVEQRMIAGIVADNVMTETLAPFTLPSTLPLQGQTDLAGQTWAWRRSVEQTQIPGFFRVNVSVTRADEDLILGSVVAFREGGL